MKEIRSVSNPRIKWARKLVQDPKQRRAQRLWVAEGVRLGEELARSGLPLRTVFLETSGDARHAALAQTLEQLADETVRVTREVMRAVSDTREPQGVLAVFDAPAFTAVHVTAGRGPVLVLDQLRDPGNLGTLARSAEAAGAAGIFLVAGSVDAGNPKALRASAGSLLRLPVARCASAEELRSLLDRPLYTTAGAGGRFPETCDLTAPFALVLGQEAHGVDPSWAAHADGLLTIPMAKKVESLNVAVAGSVVLFEAARQRRSAGLA